MDHIKKVTRRQALISGICAALGGAARAGQAPSGGTLLKQDTSLKPAADAARAALQMRISAGEMPGLVALISRGDKIERFALGNGIETDSIFRIASMTKPIAAMAALQLVEDGKLRLDEPADRLLPELANRRVLQQLNGPLDDTVPARRRFTVEDLLTFKWGMGLVLAPPAQFPILQRIAALKLLGFGPPDPAARVTPEQWLAQLARLPLMAQPGSRWMYNTGSCVLGILIARAAGISLADFLKERIFEPLKMHDTDFAVNATNAKRLTDAYQPSATGPHVSDAAGGSPWARPPVFQDAAAGLVSTAEDYLRFSECILRRGLNRQGARLLSQASVDVMTRDHLTAEQRADGMAILGEGRGWGYGLSVVSGENSSHVPQGAVGWNGGLGTSWIADPRSNTTVILLTQLGFSSPTSLGPHQDLWRAVFSSNT
jgi:CubicO group peptidase (beta-lactamase class C family)